MKLGTPGNIRPETEDRIDLDWQIILAYTNAIEPRSRELAEE